jgi:hypothetical protein
MIFLILIGATLFSLVFRALGGDRIMERVLTDLPGGAGSAVLVVMVTLFLLGFVMDAFEIIFVVVPIVAPVLLQMPGIDPVWLGANVIHAPTARPDLVLSAWRGAAGGDDAAYLSRHHSLRADSARHVACAVARTGPCNLPAASVVRLIRVVPQIARTL